MDHSSANGAGPGAAQEYDATVKEELAKRHSAGALEEQELAIVAGALGGAQNSPNRTVGGSCFGGVLGAVCGIPIGIWVASTFFGPGPARHDIGDYFDKTLSTLTTSIESPVEAKTIRPKAS